MTGQGVYIVLLNTLYGQVLRILVCSVFSCVYTVFVLSYVLLLPFLLFFFSNFFVLDNFLFHACLPNNFLCVYVFMYDCYNK